MKKNGAVLLMLLLLYVVAEKATVLKADDPECYDRCSTGCVNRDPRLMLRCDRKCQIRCSSGFAAADADLD